MKTSTNPSGCLATAIFGLLLVARLTATADNQYWNPTTTPKGAGSGVWDTGVDAWANTTAGTNAPVPWVNGNDAFFTLNKSLNTAIVNQVSANVIAFAQYDYGDATYVFQPGTGPLTITGGLNNTGAAATFNCNIVLGAGQTWYTTRSMYLNGPVTGSRMLSKTGTGTLFLSNPGNALGGLEIQDGPMKAYNGGDVLGGSSGGLVLGRPDQSATTDITLDATGSGATEYSIGPVTNAGVVRLYMNTASSTSTNILAAGELVRSGRSTISLYPQRGLSTNERLTFQGGAIASVNGMIDPWIVNVNTAKFVDYDGELKDVTFDSGAWDASKKIDNTSATNLAASATVHALKLAANVTVPSGVTLDNGSGGFIFNGGSLFGDGTVSVGTNELVAYVSGTRYLSPEIDGTGGLTVFGGGTLVISNMTYTGDTWINQGTLTVSPHSDAVYGYGVNGLGEFIKDGATSLTLSGSTGMVGKVTLNGSGALTLTDSSIRTLASVTIGVSGSSLVLSNAQMRNVGTLATASGKNDISIKIMGGGPGRSPTVLDGGLSGLTLGNAGSRNSLLVDGGGVTGGAVVTNMIYNKTGLTVGTGAKAASNTVTISNGGAVWDQITVNNAGNNFGNGAGANGNLLEVIGGEGFVSTLVKGVGNAIGSGSATGNVVRIDARGVPGSAVWSAPANDSIIVGNGGGFGNALELLDGAKLTGGGLVCGSGANSNRIEITGAGTEWKGNGGGARFVIGAGAAEGNTVVVSDGAYLWNFTTWQGAIGGQGPNIGSAPGKTSVGNSLVIRDGGSFYTANDTYVGHQAGAGAGAYNNQVLITGPDALWTATSYVYLGASGTGSEAIGNQIVVENGGQYTGSRRLLIGNLSSYEGTAANGNGAIVRNGGTLRIPYHNVWGVHGLEIGSTVTNGTAVVNAENNYCLVTGNGVLDVPVLYILSPGGNYIRIEDGGVWQMSGQRAPTIISQQFGDISMDNGIVAFASGTDFTVRDNWNYSSWTNVQFTGNNGLRLNGISLSTAAAESYLFEPNISPTNWASLQMVNGTTVYQTSASDTGSLTIGESAGSSASMLCSNTTASVKMPFVLNGDLTLFNSTLTLQQDAEINGDVYIDLDALPASGVALAAQGALTLGGSATLHLSGPLTDGMILMTYAGDLTGRFNVTGLSSDYTLGYGVEGIGTISLLHSPTILVIR